MYDSIIRFFFYLKSYNILSLNFTRSVRIKSFVTTNRSGIAVTITTSRSCRLLLAAYDRYAEAHVDLICENPRRVKSAVYMKMFTRQRYASTHA